MMKEEELADLGIFRITSPIPFPQAGGPANAYLIEEESGFLLFDTGLGTDTSQNAILEGLARTGHRFKDLNRIILSHGHIDHFGAAYWIKEQSGRAIPISIHSADAGKVLVSGADWPTLLMRNASYFSMLGVPRPLLEQTAAALGRSPSLGRQLTDVTPLIPGDKFGCKHVTLEVRHMPGHTPGLCCLYERDHRLFFSADHILERISPNPLIEFRLHDRRSSFKPLVAYFESLDRVRALDIGLVLPGHAGPFNSHLAVIESLSDFYRRRQARLLEILRTGPLTVYEAMEELFPLNSGFELILTISETLGNLEMLEERGEIEHETGDELIRFRVR